jgi:AAA15 family ATPase/GTPase
LKSLSIEYFAHLPSVFASLRGQEKKIPVGLLSDGVNKLMGILLGIAAYKGGTVLIDQIEDGFYYDRLASIWKLIYEFASVYSVQIFATTHSQECLQALLPILATNQNGFSLLRSERLNGTSTVARFDGSQMFSALSKDGEIR